MNVLRGTAMQQAFVGSRRNSQLVSRPICADRVPTARPCCLAAPSGVTARSRQLLVVHASAKTGSTVRIIIQGRKLQVTDAIKQYVEQKVGRAIANYQHTLKEVDVKLSARGGDTGTHGKREQKVEVTIYTLRNGVVRVEDSEENLYASIDVVCDKIQRKLTKVKEKAVQKGTWPGKNGPRVDVEAEDFQEYMQEVVLDTKVFEQEQALEKQFATLNSLPTTVLRSKEVSLDPISVDEAIEAMENVGHGFYVFREKGSDQIQVVYKRSEEGYGVLVPRKAE